MKKLNETKKTLLGSMIGLVVFGVLAIVTLLLGQLIAGALIAVIALVFFIVIVYTPIHKQQKPVKVQTYGVN